MNAKASEFVENLQVVQIMELLEGMPGMYIFAKDLNGRFTVVNDTLVKALGLKGQAEIIGKTDYDFFDRELADRYRAEDHEAIKQGVLEERIWLVPDLSGGFNWFLSNKRAVTNKKGEVLGIMAVMRDVRAAGAMVGPYEEMKLVLDHILKHYHLRIEVKELAALIHLSVSQFERRFKKLFYITPMQHVNQVRIRMACMSLLQSDDGIAAIAAASGFYDHSAFIKKFKQEMGVTPSDYRKQYRQADGQEARGV